MSGLRRATRHPDRINDPHERARALASDALLGEIDGADAAWLDEHLFGCGPCRVAAAAFEEGAALLRSLRAEPPPVPRDLGARVSLALDAEVRRARRGRRGADRPVRRDSRPALQGRPSLAFAGLAAVAVVALLLGPLALSPAAPPDGMPPAGSLLPAASPIVVDSQPVAWVRRLPDGTYVLSSAEVRRVCAGVDATACGTLDGGAQTLALLSMKPSSVLLPRDGSPAVIVGQNTVYAVSVNLAPPVTTPEPEPSPVTSNEPLRSPSASGEPTSPPVGSPAPSDHSASPAPTVPASEPPSAGPTLEPGNPTAEPTASDASPVPTAPASSGEPTSLPALPPASPVPTAAPAIAIADGVVLVGAPPAYSADGQWVAFSARPADGSHGPDIYAWNVGQPRALVLTDDHGSVFSGWVDDQIIVSTARVAETTVIEASSSPSPAPGASPSPAPGASPSPAPDADASATPDAARAPGPDATSGASPAPDGSPVPDALPGAAPAAEADPTTVVARSFLISPDGAVITAMARDGIWRPVVDPTDRVVVFWTGSLAWSSTDLAWLPAKGQLVVADWQAVLGRLPVPDMTAGSEATPTPGPDVTADPEATPTPVATAAPTPGPDMTADAEATPTPVATAAPDTALPAAAVGLDVVDWEVRFDPAGRRLGVWVADPAAPGTGRLSLVAINDDGTLGDVELADAAALPGFSLDTDRLAWSTPPGRNGVGSLVTVFAWSGDAAGQLYGMPDTGQEPIVVVR
jgi:hypothetical protein